MAKWIKLAAVVLLTGGLLLAVSFGQWRYSSPAVARLIDRADKLVVLRKYREDRPEVAFISTNRADLDALKKALKLTAGDMRCKCDGDPAIVLYSGGRKIGVISNQHGRAVRLEDGRADNDPKLADPESFLKWFDDRGVPDARREAEANAVAAREGEAHRARWLAAMPPAMRPLWEQVASRRTATPDVTPLLRAHARAVPDARARILELFAWNGAGGQPWNVSRGYETLTVEVLLSYPSAELIAVATNAPLTPAQAEGAARFFGGYGFGTRHADPSEMLPAPLKAKLLKHSETVTDEENRETARRIFGQ